MTVVTRDTRETRIRLELIANGGDSRSEIATGRRFLDHMLTVIAHHSGLTLRVNAEGDLQHHLAEDVAIALGTAVAPLVRPTIARHAHRTIAMDDALVECVVDLGGRPWYTGPLPSTRYDHFLRSFAFAAGATLHVRVLRGHDRHHVVEAAFKALGLALRDALVDTSTSNSTKGEAVLRVTDQ